MNFAAGRRALRWLPRPGTRPLTRAAMEVALRGARKILCVAEKNDAAKGIADLLAGGRVRRREGLSRFNKIYEFDYHLLGQNVTMIMTSVSGHLLAHDFQMQFRKWQSCNPLVLFEADIEKYCPENFVDIKKTLEREVRQCQALVIWTDCDREGENIGFEIIHVCRAVKPDLPVLRARFSEITSRAVQAACENLTEPDQRVSDAVDVRQELDLRIGAAFTRFQTLRLQKVFPEVLAEQLVSYGSCQFPTLGFVVERFKAIQAFVPEVFHKIRVTHDHRDGVVEFSWKRHRLFSHTACLVLYQLCMEDPRATVVEVRSKARSKWRPQALDTVELEKLASRKLRINAKETMRIAEKLYTQGYISYPRTETNIFPKGLDLAALVEQQTSDPRWGAFARSILEQGGPTPRNGNQSDQAHPPIHPTKYTDSLQGDEQRLYELIVRHFLACCSRDAQGQETTVEIDIAQERFVAHGLVILARNYLDVYPYDHWSDKVLPGYERGSRFQPSTVEMVDGETSPPQLLTEADLIALMEKHGIGQWLVRVGPGGSGAFPAAVTRALGSTPAPELQGGLEQLGARAGCRACERKSTVQVARSFLPRATALRRPRVGSVPPAPRGLSGAALPRSCPETQYFGPTRDVLFSCSQESLDIVHGRGSHTLCSTRAPGGQSPRSPGTAAGL
uniref:DNA topoisomerase n=1 Tax=Sus scrofa TaxID=9823 RepID=A0A480TIA2_PIG